MPSKRRRPEVAPQPTATIKTELQPQATRNRNALSFYGADAPRPALKRTEDSTYHKDASTVLANAPLLDWASKANIKAGGGVFSPAPAAVKTAAERPPSAFAKLVRDQRQEIKKDPELRAQYRDGIPAAVVMQEALTRARKLWKVMTEDKRSALEKEAKDAQAVFDVEKGGSKLRKRKSKGQADKLPRARSAFQIYAAAEYASRPGGKSAGLKGYRSFVESLKGEWAELTADQQKPFHDRAAVEKEERAVAKAATKPAKKVRKAATIKKAKGSANAAVKHYEEDDSVSSGSSSDEEEEDLFNETDDEDLTEEELRAADALALDAAIAAVHNSTGRHGRKAAAVGQSRRSTGIDMESEGGAVSKDAPVVQAGKANIAQKLKSRSTIGGTSSADAVAENAQPATKKAGKAKRVDRASVSTLVEQAARDTTDVFVARTRPSAAKKPQPLIKQSNKASATAGAQVDKDAEAAADQDVGAASNADLVCTEEYEFPAIELSKALARSGHNPKTEAHQAPRRSSRHNKG